MMSINSIKKFGYIVIIYIILFSISVFSYNQSQKSSDFLPYAVLAIITILPTWIVLQPFRSSLIWLKRTMFYFFLLITSMIISSTFLSYLGFDSNINSAQYMISALIQSEAAIIAIVITLTLVVLQHTSSTYSTRVIDVFKYRNPDFWILLMIYLFAMIYGVSVLKAVKEYDFDPIVNPSHLANLEGHIFSVYYLGVLAFIALIPYMWNTIDLLKPLKIMEFLSENITNENLQKYSDSQLSYKFFPLVHTFEKKGVEDPFQPIIDIIISSLVKYDYYTVRAGMEIIVRKTASLYKNDLQPNQLNLFLIQNTIKHFEMIGHLTAKKTDGKILYDIVEALFMIGIMTLGSKNFLMKNIVDSIERIGKLSAEKKSETALVRALIRLEDLKYKSQKTTEFNIESDISNSINNLTFVAKKHDLQNCIKEFHSSLEITKHFMSDTDE